MKKIQLLVASALLFSACGRFSNKETSANSDQRIVCISKQYSEIIYALGAEKDIVAVDISSVYPERIKKLPTVGYHRALSIEGILSAKPTLILHDNNIGPEHVTKQLQDLKIPMKVFHTKTEDIDSTVALIKEMGEYFNKQRAADSLNTILRKEMEEALEISKKYTDKPKVLVIHFGQASNIFLVMSKKGTAGKMVEWAGGEMAVTDEKGMKQLSAEVVSKSDPDVILLTDFGYDRLGTPEKIKELPGVSSTRAAKNNHIYRIEEHDLVYLGPRTGKNILLLQKLIHVNAPAN
jgi:iron complex transport system substrate-binding protein